MHSRSLLAIAALSILPFSTEPAPLRGFTAESARAEREWEGRFKAIPEPARMRDAMQRLSARPHHVGSPYDKANAEWLQQQFTSYGWDARIERFDVLFPTPKERVVELIAPAHFARSSRSRRLQPTRRAASTTSSFRPTTPIP
jgi:N-acetylated-alpha-linked acidic dipeptidase